MIKLHCRECGRKMQRWGHTKQGKPRFFCTSCQKSATRGRDDIERRHMLKELHDWLSHKESLREIAAEEHITRQALWKRFRGFISAVGQEPVMPDMISTRILIVDGTYIHGHTLCALIAIDENDKIYWKFAPYESYKAWCDFLSSFTEPEIIVMDGQKGLFAAAKTMWPKIAVQRCQFHLIAFAIQYIGRRPKEEVGKALLDVLYNLKYAKTREGREKWVESYFMWEKKYEPFLSAKNSVGEFYRPRLRSARLVIRRALPHLFTFLDHPGSPNTTNLVEGWVNGAMAEALRLHRGLRVHEKRALATVILSKLKRQKNGEQPDLAEINRHIRERLRKTEQARRARVFKRRFFQKKSGTPKTVELPLFTAPGEIEKGDKFGLSKL